MDRTASEDWMLPAGYVENRNVPRFDDLEIADDVRIWQPDVYDMAKRIATASKALIVDVGCGSGRKIKDYPAEKIVGLDLSKHIAHCSKETPEALWITCDLENIHPMIPRLISSRAVVICSDVVEHLENPNSLLKFLAFCSTRAMATIVSTPDREIVRGLDDLGPPANAHHVREWSLIEFMTLLRSYSFNISLAGHTREHNETESYGTITVASVRSEELISVASSQLHFLPAQ